MQTFRKAKPPGQSIDQLVRAHVRQNIDVHFDDLLHSLTAKGRDRRSESKAEVNVRHPLLPLHERKINALMMVLTGASSVFRRIGFSTSLRWCGMQRTAFVLVLAPKPGCWDTGAASHQPQDREANRDDHGVWGHFHRSGSAFSSGRVLHFSARRCFQNSTICHSVIQVRPAKFTTV